MPSNQTKPQILSPETTSVGEFANVPIQQAIEPFPRPVPKPTKSKQNFDFDVNESKGRGIGCGSIFSLIKTLGCSCFAVILLLIIVLVVLVVVRPPNFWEPVKQWLNVSLVDVPAPQTTPTDVYKLLNDQLKTFGTGKNTLVVTEQQLQVIAKDKIKLFQLDSLNVDVSSSNIKFYWNLEAGAKNPLWAVVEAKPDTKGFLAVSKIGTERIPVPYVFNDLMLNVVTSGAKLVQGNGNANLVNLFLNFPANTQIESVQLRDGEVLINLNITTGLDGFLLQN